MAGEIDPLKFPSRRPWLVLAAMLVVAAAVWYRYSMARHPVAVRTSLPVPAAPAIPPRSAALPTQTVVAAASVPSPASAPSSPPATNAAPPATNVAPSSSAIAVTNIDERLSVLAAVEGQGQLLAARTNYLALYKESLGDAARATVEERLGKINVALVTTPMAMPEKEDCIVAPGDSMDRIAKKFGTTVALIQKGNERTNALIKVGDRLRVFKGRFEVTVSKSRNELLLTMNGDFFKRYGAGTGRYGKTPVGTFVIADRVAEPVWWHPDGREIPFGDPANILGTRWLALRATGTTLPVKGYGLHGTWDEASIGKAESAGCVRLRNRDVEEIFDLLPIGTPVTITE